MKKWIKEELDFIRKNCNELDNVQLAKVLNSNSNSIKCVIRFYSIKRSKEALKKFRLLHSKKEKLKRQIRYKKVKCQYPELGYCWICTSHNKDSQGYIQVIRHKKQYQMHRYSYEKKYGFIPKGLFVLHKCDTPKCINPNHLFLGNHTDNALDMVQKGRGRNQYGTTLLEGTIRIHNGYKHIKLNKKWVYVKKISG